MKSLLKWIIIIITSLIFIYAFSASYSSQNIDNLDYVIALGIDQIDNSSNMEFSFEFADISSFSENNSSEDNKPIIDKVSAPSISSAITILNSYLGKRLNLSHCKVVVISQELAKNGISSEVSALMNNTQIRPTSNIIISEDKASTYIEKSTSSLEQILTKYYDIFPTSGEYTGYTSNILLGNFYKELINSTIGATAIFGEITSSSEDNQSDYNSSSNGDSENSNSSSKRDDEIISGESITKGDRGTENVGLCVFKDAKYIGDLNSLDTLCYSILKNEVDNFLINIENPFSENDKIDISLEELSSTNITIDTKKENPIINIKVNLAGKIVSDLEDINLADSSNLIELNNSVKNYLENIFFSFLYKTSKEYQTDINNFYKYAKRNFKTISTWNSYNWEENYKNAKFNVDINSDIISSLLLKKS